MTEKNVWRTVSWTVRAAVLAGLILWTAGFVYWRACWNMYDDPQYSKRVLAYKSASPAEQDRMDARTEFREDFGLIFPALTVALGLPAVGFYAGLEVLFLVLTLSRRRRPPFPPPLAVGPQNTAGA